MRGERKVRGCCLFPRSRLQLGLLFCLRPFSFADTDLSTEKERGMRREKENQRTRLDDAFILSCRCGVMIVFRRRWKERTSQGVQEEQLTLGVTQVNRERNRCTTKEKRGKTWRTGKLNIITGEKENQNSPFLFFRFGKETIHHARKPTTGEKERKGSKSPSPWFFAFFPQIPQSVAAVPKMWLFPFPSLRSILSSSIVSLCVNCSSFFLPFSFPPCSSLSCVLLPSVSLSNFPHVAAGVPAFYLNSRDSHLERHKHEERETDDENVIHCYTLANDSQLKEKEKQK